MFDFETAAPGFPLEDFLWIGDHGLGSLIFQSFLDGYLERSGLNPGAPERFAFYQLEHCLDISRPSPERVPPCAGLPESGRLCDHNSK